MTMPKKFLALLLLAGLSVSLSHAEEPRVARVSALASGELRLDGTTISLAELDGALEKLQQEKGVVWYFRENAKAEPTEQAMSALKLIMQHRLPVSLSSKADFSDYIDDKGRSKPRKP